ncbi:MAG: serine/threonine-protein kinase [Polyangiales bacterium]
MTKPAALHPGDVIAGRYKVVRRLGSGGMGAVFEAENLRTGRRVALKIVHAELAAKPELARRFEREARAAAQLEHPHVVDILDLGDDAARGIQFLVQEFLEGESLADRMVREGPLSPRAALEALTPIADALAAVHAAGLVHRDVKPENVFLQRRGEAETPKLIDFGVVAYAAGPPTVRLTKAGTLVGTPAYMSPEQALDASVDGRADLWSLGVVLYEALSGERPYDADDPDQLLAKIRFEAPRPLASVMPGLPASLVAAVDRALQRDRAARWPTAVAFRDALRLAAMKLSAAQFDDRTTVMSPRDDPRPAVEEPTTVRAPEEPPREAVRVAVVVRDRPARGRAVAFAALVVAAGVGLGLVVNRAVRPRPVAAIASTVIAPTQVAAQAPAARVEAPPPEPAARVEDAGGLGASAPDADDDAVVEAPAPPARPARPARPRRQEEYRPHSI